MAQKGMVLPRCHMTKFISKTVSKFITLETWMAPINKEIQSVTKLKLQLAMLEIVSLWCCSRDALLPFLYS